MRMMFDCREDSVADPGIRSLLYTQGGKVLPCRNNYRP